jgi:hypothetical protein
VFDTNPFSSGDLMGFALGGCCVLPLPLDGGGVPLFPVPAFSVVPGGGVNVPGP